MKQLAIFDFDHTLVAQDSMPLFLAELTGWPRLILTVTAAVLLCGLARATGNAMPARDFIKEYLLRNLLAGRRRDDLRAAALTAARKQKINAPVMRALRDHHAAGAVIVVASGGLDVYLPEFLRDVPHDALICTEVGIKNGLASGEMIKGNCVRARKAERVAAWIAANGPFEETFAYGNYPDDVPLLNLVKHRILVS